MSFWDHLEALRGTVLRSLLAVAAVSAVVLCFKSAVFDGVVLAPSRSDFPVYRMMGGDFSMQLVNLDISAQFFIHLKVSVMAGFILACPYVLFEIWKFIAPALYEREKKAIRTAFFFAGGLFYAGLVTGYFLVLPFALNFFQNYTVSDVVANTISLQSYISMFSSLVLAFGLVFEFPAVVAALSRAGVIDRGDLVRYRKYAIVAILVVAAIITPADPFSMVVAAVPLYLLYEGSVLVCRKENRKAR